MNQTSAALAHPLHLLLVEENAQNILEFCEGLRNGDIQHKITECYQGEQALELLNHEPALFDLIVIDNNLPDMSGLELCREIIQKQPPAPVVMLIGAGSQLPAVEALKAGAADYLIKDPAREYLGLLPVVLPKVVQQHRDRLARQAAEENWRQSEKELRQYSQKLQARNEELDTFAHTVAHELQSPLGHIIGFASALQEYELTDAERSAYTQLIVEAGHKMEAIIHDLLMLTSVRRLTIQPTPLDMHTIIAAAQQHLTYLIKQYQAQIIVPDDWPTVRGYAPWVEEVWSNYISNAVKYGGHPPVIELGATPLAGGMISFWVRDNGHGLTAEEQQELFKPFTRLPNTKIKGNGLGLSIVRQIVEKLGGQVGVTSHPPPAPGATFSFTLPQ